MEILHRDDLPQTGFAGVREYRLVLDKRVAGATDTSATDKIPWNGIGSFVYLADAHFIANGETKMHSHSEIDVISLMVAGRIAHQGSLAAGGEIATNQVQVQRAGGAGFSHNEINPDDVQNRMIQMWVLPEKSGEPAGYKLYDLTSGKLTHIYGGKLEQNDTFASHTHVEIGLLNPQQEIKKSGDYLAYVTLGNGSVNGVTVADGDLLRGVDLHFTAVDQVQMIIVQDHP